MPSSFEFRFEGGKKDEIKRKCESELNRKEEEEDDNDENHLAILHDDNLAAVKEKETYRTFKNRIKLNKEKVAAIKQM